MTQEVLHYEKGQQQQRKDAGIQAEVWMTLWKADDLRSLEINSMDVKVREGEVWLIGHVVNAYHRRLAENLVRTVSGVSTVHNELVADTDLVLDVAQALAADSRTHPYIIPVGVSHGWVQLGGEVPTLEARLIAEEVAASVPAVRGVLTLPHLPGKTDLTCVETGKINCLVQPKIGDRVYAEDGPAGKVAEVIINPRNRLVSHIAVDANYEINGRSVNGKFVVPACAIKAAPEGSLFLTDSLSELAARPVFREEDFPMVPTQWRPPYPYDLGVIRWSIERSE